jgi:hypothetical protein
MSKQAFEEETPWPPTCIQCALTSLGDGTVPVTKLCSCTSGAFLSDAYKFLALFQQQLKISTNVNISPTHIDIYFWKHMTPAQSDPQQRPDRPGRDGEQAWPAIAPRLPPSCPPLVLPTWAPDRPGRDGVQAWPKLILELIL